MIFTEILKSLVRIVLEIFSEVAPFFLIFCILKNPLIDFKYFVTECAMYHSGCLEFHLPLEHLSVQRRVTILNQPNRTPDYNHLH